MKVCTVENCGKSNHAKGYCGMHYHSLVRYEDPLATKRGVRDGEALSWLESRIEEPFGEECVEWPFSKLVRGGYGYMYTKTKKHKRITHIILERFEGPQPEDKPFALHTCHNPPCINPNHLMWGDHETNMQQMYEAGRNRTHKGQMVGEKNPTSILTEEGVREIFRLYREGVPQNKLAPMFGVAKSTINAIIKGKLWAYMNLFDGAPKEEL